MQIFPAALGALCSAADLVGSGLAIGCGRSPALGIEYISLKVAYG